MNMTFEDLKKAAMAAKDEVELFKISQETNEKYLRNVRRAQFLSFSAGNAAEAEHLFQNVIPGWYAINEEILAMLRDAMAGKSSEEIIEIIRKAA